MIEVFILTYFPETDFEMILGVFSSTEKVAKNIEENQVIKLELKPTREEVESTLKQGRVYKNEVFKVERFIVY